MLSITSGSRECQLFVLRIGGFYQWLHSRDERCLPVSVNSNEHTWIRWKGSTETRPRPEHQRGNTAAGITICVSRSRMPVNATDRQKSSSGRATSGETVRYGAGMTTTRSVPHGDGRLGACRSGGVRCQIVANWLGQSPRGHHGWCSQHHPRVSTLRHSGRAAEMVLVDTRACAQHFPTSASSPRRIRPAAFLHRSLRSSLRKIALLPCSLKADGEREFANCSI